MAEEYTPTEERVQAHYVAAAYTGEEQRQRLAGFVRFMAEVRREVAEKAWDECARTVRLRDFEAVCDPNPYRKEQS